MKEPLYRQLLFVVPSAILFLVLVALSTYLGFQVGDGGWWRREIGTYNRAHAIPDDENAAVGYRKLHFHRLEGDIYDHSDWRLPLSTSELESLFAQRDALSELSAVTRRSGCFYPFPEENKPGFAPASDTVFYGSGFLVFSQGGGLP